jgi:hypothetical protein
MLVSRNIFTGEPYKSYDVYTSLSTWVYTSNQGNKVSSPHHLPQRFAEFLLKGVNKR